jgi:2-dehydro-3-deoxygalactonokinase
VEDSTLFIAGDWGTTSLRLTLCRGAEVLGRANGPGVGVQTGALETIFRSLSKGWIAEHGPLPAFLCGMVGTRIGWIETPYVPCPAGSAAVRRAAVRFILDNAPVAIVPGLSCRNPLGAPDVMRGEETQIFGALAVMPAVARGRHLLVLPGTHAKWAIVEDGMVQSFLSAMTGEIFALLRVHSVLSMGDGNPAAGSTGGFAKGIARLKAMPAGAIMHLLFEVRSRQLLEAMPRDEAMDFLSGLLIGADVAAALQWFGTTTSVMVIGEPALAARYGEALEAFGVAANYLDGATCALAGLRALFVNTKRGEI